MATHLASAPGRVNLIGEHTDYNGGLCLPFALPLETTVELTPRPDGEVHLRSAEAGRWDGTLDDVRAGAATGWAAYVAGVLWALAEAGHPVPGCDLRISSTVPLGAGLSSSASLEAAVAVALADHLGLPLDDAGRRSLATACIRAETEYVGAPTGGLDQLAVLLAEEGTAVLIDFEEPTTTRRVPLALPGAGLGILVTDTGVRHQLAAGGGYAERRAQCEAAARALGRPTLRPVEIGDLDRLYDPVLRRRARHVVTENARVTAVAAAAGAGDWTRVGAHLTASHASLRDDFEVTVPALDLAAATAEEHGALGARMTGGGFGGSTLALVPLARADAVRAGIDEAFTRHGLPRPTHHLVEPSAGARPLSR
ncbi:galactokinase [Nocardioides sp. GY 10113]|uniref:galactokinase n=1 Tax=Nocardioides sp. GY 10113 TaxID=2569761 RepID=UPI001F0F2282|nr:galactokinase [Nocardioides sp. GY 10113]